MPVMLSSLPCVAGEGRGGGKFTFFMRKRCIKICTGSNIPHPSLPQGAAPRQQITISNLASWQSLIYAAHCTC